MTNENNTVAFDIKKTEELSGMDLTDYDNFTIIQRLDVLMAMMAKLNEPSAAEIAFKGE